MWFRPIIRRWGVAQLASALGLPAKNVRRWDDNDSIPAEWFASLARAAPSAGHPDITLELLADTAERRRLSKAAGVEPAAA